MLRNFWVLGADPFLLTPVAGQPRTTKSFDRLSRVPLRCRLCVMILLLYCSSSVNVKCGSPNPMLFLLLMEYHMPSRFRTGSMGTSPLGGTFVMTSTVNTVSRVLATSWSTLRTWGSFSSLHFP